nr:MAG TPA: hypothetical protein [Caudoviricetes sp.]
MIHPQKVIMTLEINKLKNNFHFQKKGGENVCTI